MLKGLLGSVNAERVLLFITARGEGHAGDIARHFGSALSPIQNQLERLERNSILVSRLIGRTRIFTFNPRYSFKIELEALLQKALDFLPGSDRDKLIHVRKRPRRKGKPL